MSELDGLSLGELKTRMALAAGQISRMRSYQDAFRQGASSLVASGDHTSSARSRVSSGWEGTAHDAADTATSRMQGYFSQSADAANTSASAMDQLASSTHSYNSQVQAIPDIDTTFGASMRASGNNPILAIVDNIKRQDQADQNRRQALASANAMNDEGYSQSGNVRGAQWPQLTASSATLPPDPPPPPAAPPASPAQPQPGYRPGYGGGTNPAPVYGTPGGRGYNTRPDDPGGGRRRPGATTEPGRPTAPVKSPVKSPPTSTGAQGGTPGEPGTPTGSSGTTPVEVPPTVGGSPGSTTAPAGATPAGGTTPGPTPSTGADGGAVPGGRPGTVALEPVPNGLPTAPPQTSAGNTGADSPGEGASGSGRGRSGQSEQSGDGARRPGGPRSLDGRPLDGRPLDGPGESRLAPRPGAGSLAEPRLAAPSEPILRSGVPGLAMSDALAAEHAAGALPFLPGSGARRNDDDEQERRIPDYLDESDDPWTGEVRASPGVIGE